MGILERIKEIEQEMDKTQRNKATEGHLGMLKARLAKLRSELLTPSSGGGGGQVIWLVGFCCRECVHTCHGRSLCSMVEADLQQRSSAECFFFFFVSMCHISYAGSFVPSVCVPVSREKSAVAVSSREKTALGRCIYRVQKTAVQTTRQQRIEQPTI